jgi:hypothetical protein
MSQNECLSPGIGVILDFVAGCAWQVQCIVRVSSKYGRSNASMCELQQNDCAKQYGGLPFMISLGREPFFVTLFACVHVGVGVCVCVFRDTRCYAYCASLCFWIVWWMWSLRSFCFGGSQQVSDVHCLTLIFGVGGFQWYTVIPILPSIT